MKLSRAHPRSAKDQLAVTRSDGAALALVPGLHPHRACRWPLGSQFSAFYAIWAQTFDLKRVGTMPERNTVFDVDGKIYSRLAGANRLKGFSSNRFRLQFVQAPLAREDTRFYEHGGIDWRGVARALVRDIQKWLGQRRREQHHPAARAQQSAVRRSHISAANCSRPWSLSASNGS